ncbi:MAG: hypothetical protein ACREP0_10570 [Rhodanobacteraceae bacterium]
METPAVQSACGLPQNRFASRVLKIPSGHPQFHLVIPGLPALFAGRTRNPAFTAGTEKSWIPGSIVDEADDGPGMTMFL